MRLYNNHSNFGNQMQSNPSDLGVKTSVKLKAAQLLVRLLALSARVDVDLANFQYFKIESAKVRFIHGFMEFNEPCC